MSLGMSVGTAIPSWLSSHGSVRGCESDGDCHVPRSAGLGAGECGSAHGCVRNGRAPLRLIHGGAAAGTARCGKVVLLWVYFWVIFLLS